MTKVSVGALRLHYSNLQQVYSLHISLFKLISLDVVQTINIIDVG